MFVILGATGKLGRATAQTLRGRGLPVRAVVRDRARAGELAAWGCEIAVADLRDRATVAAVLDGAAAVQVICPVSTQTEDAALDMRLAIDAVAAALDAARPARVVAISDYGAQLSEGTGIALVFHYLESVLGKIPTELTLLRSAEHMQNWARVLKPAIETGVLPTFHDPVTKWFPTVSAPDVGVIAADCLTTPNGSPTPHVVHVEGPRRYNAVEVAATLSAIIGRDVVARSLPQSDRLTTLVRGGISASYAALVVEMFDAHNAGRIGVEDGAGEVRRGTTELRDVFATLTSGRYPLIK